jgi:hypothetical protein
VNVWILVVMLTPITISVLCLVHGVCFL